MGTGKVQAQEFTIQGDFGVRIEDLVMVTEDGCRVLNSYPKELTIIE